MLILFYVVMVALPVLTCLTAYYQSLQFVIDREMNSQASLAQVGLEQVELSLQGADQYAATLMSLQPFNSWLAVDASPKNILTSRMKALLGSLPAFRDSSGLISRSYIYSASSDSILDKNSGYLNLPLHYDKQFALEGYDFDAWRALLRDHRAACFLPSAPDARGRAVLYSRRVSYGVRQGRVVFYLDTARLLELFHRVNAYAPKGFLALYDRDGALLYTDAEMEATALFQQYGAFSGYTAASVEGENMLLCAASLPAYGWTLYIATPRAHFIESAMQISLGILWRLLPLLLISTLLALLLLRNSHRPLRQALNHLPNQQSQTLNPFKFVQQQVDLLAETNRRQEQALRESRGELREAMLSSLIYQKQAPDFPLGEKLAELGLSFESDHYRALVLTLFSPAGEKLPITDRMHMVVLDLAEGLGENVRYLKMDSPEHMLYLALLEDTPGRMDALQRALNAFCRDIAQTLNCDVRMYVGQECDRLADVPHSFKSARHLLALRPVSEGYLVCARDRGVTPAYDYPSADAKQLRQLADVGNLEALRALLASLYQRNSGPCARTPFEKQLLCAHLIDTLIAAGYQGPLDEEIVRSLADIPLERFFALLDKYYQSLCEQRKSSEKTEQRQLVQQLLEYVRTHYADYELSVGALALKFGLSDRRLSALIREETGLSFPDYLEKTRVDRALELLQGSRKTIEEIALAVGYASDKSFRRAFKRRTGQSPSAFRSEKV